MNQAEQGFVERRSGPIFFCVNRHQFGRRNLLFLHGALGSADKLKPFANGFGDCNILICDLRGHGQSERVASGYDPNSLAGDLIGPALHTFGQQPFVAIAESLSGIIALQLARQLANFHRIVMIDTSFDNARMQRALKTLVASYENQVELREVTAVFAREFFALDVKGRRASSLNYARYLQDINVPILMITGSRKHDDDPKALEPGATFNIADFDALRRYKARFSMVEIEGGGHRLIKTHQAQVARAIRDFLESQIAQTASSGEVSDAGLQSQ